MILEVLSFIFVLGLLIFVHELGHFAVAKKSGIRVEKFSLGFPPKIFSFRYGETEYCISWIPLGGYVKMAGEIPDEQEISGAPDEFMSKPVWKRALVIVAGPVMNYILAVVLLIGIFLFKGQAVTDDTKAVIGMIQPDSPAEQVGIQPKDVMISVDGQEVSSFQDMYEIVTKKPDKEINLVWLRGDDTLSANATTRSDTTLDLQGEVIIQGKLGVGIDHSYQPLSFGNAVVSGFNMTNFYVTMTLKFLKDLITGSVSTKLIGGPLFIAQAAGQAARDGFASLLILASILSVNLCIVNLMPIPVLDGGQLVILLVEKIKGSPVSLKARAIMQQVGFVAVLALIVIVTKNDIWRISLFGW